MEEGSCGGNSDQVLRWDSLAGEGWTADTHLEQKTDWVKLVYTVTLVVVVDVPLCQTGVSYRYQAGFERCGQGGEGAWA